MDKKIRWVRYSLAFFIGLLLYNLLSGPSGLIGLATLHRENLELKNEADSLLGVHQALEVEKVRLKGDTAYLEELARRELGMARPEEKVFRFVPSAPPQ